MQQLNLTNFYSGFGIKRLSSHEVDETVSHGHEFQGITDLRALLGPVKHRFEAEVVILQDTEPTQQRFNTELTWYNSRVNQPNRTPEWRLYYPHDAIFMRHASPDDLIIITKTHAGNLQVFIARKNSAWERKLMWLFQKNPSPGVTKFTVPTAAVPVDFSAESILEEIVGPKQAEVLLQKQVDPEAAVLAEILASCAEKLPSSKQMSRIAREKFPGGADIRDLVLTDPDRVLTEWVSWEYRIFRTFEKLYTKRAVEKFKDSEDVTELGKFFQSFQQRRFSRAGSSFENHVETILMLHGVGFTRHAKTENKKEPDFVFPGAPSYHDPKFPDADLRMLGCKTSCKDRWRQVLSEAKRISLKHLITLEPGISKDQTDEMHQDNLQLVLPKSLHSSYDDDQKKQIISFEVFLNEVKDIERRHARPTSGRVYVLKN
jgi:hypothetical protein